MGLLELILIIAVIGFFVWAIVTYVPMHQIFKAAIIALACIAIVILLLRVLGIGDIPIGKIR